MCHDLLDMEGNKHVIEVILFFFLILQLFSVSLFLISLPYARFPVKLVGLRRKRR